MEKNMKKVGALIFAAGACAAANAQTANVIAGWNLMGYSGGSTLTAANLGNTDKYSTAWKWNASTGKWAFFTPTLADGGAAYAASKGYEFMTGINSGDGFWINASAPFSVTLSSIAVGGSTIPVNAEASAGIKEALDKLLALYATAKPAATNAVLADFFADNALMGGANKAQIIQAFALTSNGPSIGDKLDSITLATPLDAGAQANDASHQWFKMVVKGPGSNGGNQNNLYLATKSASTGKWQFSGDQRSFGLWGPDVSSMKIVSKNGTSYGYNFEAGLNIPSGFQVLGSTGTLVNGVEMVLISGPGVASHPALPPGFAFVYHYASKPSMGLNTCNTGTTANCIDISKITADAKYTYIIKGLAMPGLLGIPAMGVTSSSSATTSTTSTGTSASATPLPFTLSYTNAIANAPLSSGEVAALSFPEITSTGGTWLSGSTATITWTLPTAYTSNYISLNGNDTSNNSTNINSGKELKATDASASITLPTYTGTLNNRSIWLKTYNASGRGVALNLQDIN